jgi:GTP cyclohydrolase-4
MMCQVEKSKSASTKVYLGLGSNLGDRQGNLSMSVKLLSDQINVERISSIYETEPVGYLEQPKFLNAVLRSTTHLTPEMLLALVKDVEKALGRVSSFVNAPRPIDIDILFYGTRVISSPQLTIPHPRLEERAFVLVPLAEIAPSLRHPVSRRTAKEMVKKVVGLEGVKKYKQEIKDV